MCIRDSSIVTKVKKQIDSGNLGKIVAANVMCWLYKNKDWYKEKWRIKKGGGPLGINLVHDIDLICYLLGPITHVQATTSNKIIQNEKNITEFAWNVPSDWVENQPKVASFFYCDHILNQSIIVFLS